MGEDARNGFMRQQWESIYVYSLLSPPPFLAFSSGYDFLGGGVISGWEGGGHGFVIV